jgi:sortase A
MARTNPRLPADDDTDLLGTLLAGDVPSRRADQRPVQLRSAAEQRRIALSGFRLRTWVDTFLHRLERALVVAAALVFCYWLLDGYGRDWLYAWRQATVAQAEGVSITPTPPLRLPDTAPPAVAAELPALPFTTPSMSADVEPSADFLVPQPLGVVPAAADPRPQRLIMPTLGVDTPVQEVFIENNAWQVANYAAGYHHGTALPGNIGNTVLAGHAGLRGAVFRDLGRLKPGAEVVVETGGWRYVYRVRELKSVWPTQVDVMDPTPTPVLTLITCTNWDTQRLIVVADLSDARPLQ